LIRRNASKDKASFRSATHRIDIFPLRSALARSVQLSSRSRRYSSAAARGGCCS